ncbi:unnamed protein product [Effrenium voratum]|uniref:Uncharacterized protein n=1 Tax=Effrenium voratum TaxID=2562239 RepID=A0AA36NAQ5_9DINO|nr:unnamed protein product [Effrenium voratum]
MERRLKIGPRDTTPILLAKKRRVRNKLEQALQGCTSEFGEEVQAVAQCASELQQEELSFDTGLQPALEFMGCMGQMPGAVFTQLRGEMSHLLAQDLKSGARPAAEKVLSDMQLHASSAKVAEFLLATLHRLSELPGGGWLTASSESVILLQRLEKQAGCAGIHVPVLQRVGAGSAARLAAARVGGRSAALLAKDFARGGDLRATPPQANAARLEHAAGDGGGQGIVRCDGSTADLDAELVEIPEPALQGGCRGWSLASSTGRKVCFRLPWAARLSWGRAAAEHSAPELPAGCGGPGPSEAQRGWPMGCERRDRWQACQLQAHASWWLRRTAAGQIGELEGIHAVEAQVEGSRLVLRQLAGDGMVYKCHCDVSADQMVLMNGQWECCKLKGSAEEIIEDVNSIKGTFTAKRLGVAPLVDSSFREWDDMTQLLVETGKLQKNEAADGKALRHWHAALKDLRTRKAHAELEADLSWLLADPFGVQDTVGSLLKLSTCPEGAREPD